jgi:adenylosuccinate synthase
MNFMNAGTLSMIMDGQFGSTGKGLAASYVAMEDDLECGLAITNNAPNAGHTFDIGAGKHTVYHLPAIGVIQGCPMHLTAGAMIDPDKLAEEMEEFNVRPGQLTIDPNAVLILPKHKAMEIDGTHASHIASTQKGVGAALAQKLMRAGNVAKNCDQFGYGWLRKHIVQVDVTNRLERGFHVLMEVPQGFALGVNAGFYPHCTSRDITVMQALNDARVHPHFLGSTMMTLRTYPIRVGNIVRDGVTVGESGPVYEDQEELNWTQLGVEPELTTVTKRVRRVFTFSELGLAKALRESRPTHLFLNFCNYLTCPEEFFELNEAIANVVQEEDLPMPEMLFGFGPKHTDVYPGENLSVSTVDSLPWRMPMSA